MAESVSLAQQVAYRAWTGSQQTTDLCFLFRFPPGPIDQGRREKFQLMNEAAAHSTPGALEEGRRGASGQWWSVDFYYSYSRGRMVTHARARVFCSLKGTGFIELRISTDSTDQPTFARPPFPSAHPFRSSRSRFGSYAPTIRGTTPRENRRFCNALSRHVRLRAFPQAVNTRGRGLRFQD